MGHGSLYAIVKQARQALSLELGVTKSSADSQNITDSVVSYPATSALYSGNLRLYCLAFAENPASDQQR